MSLRLLGLAVAGYVAALLCAAVTLPERTPIHLGVSGEATTYAVRDVALLVLAGLGLGPAAVLWWAGRVVRHGSIHLLNVPHTQWWTRTAERERRMRRMLREDTGRWSVATMALLVPALATTISAAQLDQPRLGLAFVAGLAASLAAALLLLARTYGRRYHPDHQDDL